METVGLLDDQGAKGLLKNDREMVVNLNAFFSWPLSLLWKIGSAFHSRTADFRSGIERT